MLADTGSLRRAIEEADIVPLTMSLVQQTGDLSWLDKIAPHIRGAWDYMQSVPDDLAREIRQAMLQTLLRSGAGEPVMAEPDAATLQHMLSVAVGSEVSAEYIPLIVEQIGFAGGEPRPRTAGRATDGSGRVLNAIVVGAGAAGVYASIRFREAGIPHIIFEKNVDVGGTWFENRYPGCAVDTPNHFYQYSFEPNNDWPNYYSRREAIRDYIAGVAEKHGVREAVRFEAEVVAATYDEQRQVWRVSVRTASGIETHEASILVTAVGQLNRPAIPSIPGLDAFAGQYVHTASWHDGIDITDKRVVLIGTGASAVQVGPAMVDDVAALTVMQRSAPWVVRSPNMHRLVSEATKWALHNLPFYAQWYRFQLFWGFADGLFPALKIDPEWSDANRSINALNAKLRKSMVRYIEQELEGREDLLEKAIPDYPPYGKRVLADCGWYKMMRRDHVEVVTDPIRRIVAEGVELESGRVVPADVIVFATGFHAARMLWPMDIVGRGGVSIRQVWGDDDPRAYLGMTVPDFPNLFVLYGPNTGLGHGGSAIFLAECQVNFVIGCIELMRERNAGEFEVRRDVASAYQQEIDEELKALVWSHPSVRSWYKNKSGRIVINQPWRLIDYWNATRRPEPEEYHLS